MTKIPIWCRNEEGKWVVFPCPEYAHLLEVRSGRIGFVYGKVLGGGEADSYWHTYRKYDFVGSLQ